MSIEEREEIKKAVKKNNRFWAIVMTAVITLATGSLWKGGLYAVNDLKDTFTHRVNTWDSSAIKVDLALERIEKHERHDSTFAMQLISAFPKLKPRFYQK